MRRYGELQPPSGVAQASAVWACPSPVYVAGIKSQNQKESRWTISPK
jgi:hypothetical protein